MDAKTVTQPLEWKSVTEFKGLSSVTKQDLHQENSTVVTYRKPSAYLVEERETLF